MYHLPNMADEAEQNEPETVKKSKRVLAHLGVVEVEGAGIKIVPRPQHR